MIFNTHSHINDLNEEEISDELRLCKENDVQKIAAVGYDLDSSFRALSCANRHEEIFAICGIQPCELDSFHDEFNLLKQYIEQKKCIGIGEIGLDYYYGKEDKIRQKIYFEKQLQLASMYKKPVIIHCRDAYLDTYELLEKYVNQLDGIILHCYSGSVEMMQRFLNLGCYISLSGVVTFKNAKECKEVAKKVDLNKLLVETDDPYLTPTPYRGEKNHASYVTYVINEIAAIRNMEIEEIKKATFENALRVFHL